MLRCRAHTETPTCSYREPLPWATALANASPTASTTSSTVSSGNSVVSSSPRIFWRMMLPCASSTGTPNFTRLCVLTAIHSIPFLPLVQYHYRLPPRQDHRLITADLSVEKRSEEARRLTRHNRIVVKY